jgi:CheY-like chemotaxis protein
MPSGLKVLIVDDHPINRLVLTQIFEHLDCRVTTASDGAAALAAVSEGAFDLICLDRHMPGLSGDEVAQRLPADSFVVVWTTDTVDLPSRYNGVLAKPVSIDAASKAALAAKAWRAAA